MIHKISETIQAATIQADASVHAANIQATATVNAAYVSAVGIVLGLLISWLTAKFIQRKTSVDELRRSTYLKTVESYSALMGVITMIPVNPQIISKEFALKVDHFAVSMDQAMFVCETETKEKIVEFYKIFVEEFALIKNDIFKIGDASEDCDLAYKMHADLMSELEPIKSRLIDLQIENPAQKNIEHALKLLEDKIEFSNKYLEDANNKDKDLQILCFNVNSNIKKFEEIINSKAIDVMYCLRQEIGINTNKNLDMQLNERLKELLVKRE